MIVATLTIKSMLMSTETIDTDNSFNHVVNMHSIHICLISLSTNKCYFQQPYHLNAFVTLDKNHNICQLLGTVFH